MTLTMQAIRRLPTYSPPNPGCLTKRSGSWKRMYRRRTDFASQRLVMCATIASPQTREGRENVLRYGCVHLRAYGHKPRRDPRGGSCGLWAAGFEVPGKLDDLVFRFDRRHEFDRLWVTRRSIAAFARGGHHLSVAPRGGTRGTLWVPPCRSMALGVCGRHREHALVRRLRCHRTGVSEGSCVACPRADPVGTAIRDRSDRDLSRFHCNRNRGRISIPSSGPGLIFFTIFSPRTGPVGWVER